MSGEFRIGRLARATQTTPPTIRYYEDIGLLPAPPRQAGSQRVYGDADVQRLTFIRRCRNFGFPIDKVRVLLSLAPSHERSCGEARDVAFAHLVEVRAKLGELHELERAMAAFVDRCDRNCADGVGVDCVMLEDLAHGGLGDSLAPNACCSQNAVNGKAD